MTKQQVVWGFRPELLSADPEFIGSERSDFNELTTVAHVFDRLSEKDLAAHARALRRRIVRTAFHRTYPDMFKALTKNSYEEWKRYLPCALTYWAWFESAEEQRALSIPAEIVEILGDARMVFKSLFVRFHSKGDHALFGELPNEGGTVLIARWAPENLVLPLTYQMRDIVRMRTAPYGVRKSLAYGAILGALIWLMINLIMKLGWDITFSTKIGFPLAVVTLFMYVIAGGAAGIAVARANNRALWQAFRKAKPQFEWAI